MKTIKRVTALKPAPEEIVDACCTFNKHTSSKFLVRFENPHEVDSFTLTAPNIQIARARAQLLKRSIGFKGVTTVFKIIIPDIEIDLG